MKELNQQLYYSMAIWYISINGYIISWYILIKTNGYILFIFGTTNGYIILYLCININSNLYFCTHYFTF
jgi:hypothetical protein